MVSNKRDVMNALRVFLNRLPTLLRSRQTDRELDDEIASHLAEARSDSEPDLWLPVTLQNQLQYRNNTSSYGDIDNDRTCSLRIWLRG